MKLRAIVGLSALCAVVAGCSTDSSVGAAVQSQAKAQESMNVYDFSVKARKGATLNLADLKGKVILVVNTATGCGFTPQYEGLESLYAKYHDRGLEILDFPCNQFGHQAPGSGDEIRQFCTLKYNTTFDQLAKVEVNGANAEPLFTFLKARKPADDDPAEETAAPRPVSAKTAAL